MENFEWWVDPNFKKREPKPKPPGELLWDSLHKGTAINIMKGTGNPAFYVADPQNMVYGLNRKMRREIFGTRKRK